MITEELLLNLERELRRQKRQSRALLGAIVIIGVGLIALVALKITTSHSGTKVASVAEEIHAKSFVLEDENGAMRAAFSIINDTPFLTMLDENSKPRLGLTVDKDGPLLDFMDENGKIRFRLTVFKEGPGIAMYNENGKLSLGQAVSKEGPSLYLFDLNDIMRAYLSVEQEGPKLALLDERGATRFLAGKTALASPEGRTITYPESSLILFGPDGKVIWSAIK